MLVGGFTWQDYVLASQIQDFAGTVTIVPMTQYDFPWWKMVENRTRENGGRSVNYVPRNPLATLIPELSHSVLCNLSKFTGDQDPGAVQIIDKIGVIPARSWFLAGFLTRPQRGDTLETVQETFYVEHVDVVEKEAPDKVVRDLKYRLRLTGAAHQR